MRVVLRWPKGKFVQRFRFIFDVRKNLRNLNKEAAFDSMKNVLAVLGLGLLIGDFATMHLVYAVPGAALLVALWYGDYLRHDFGVEESVVEGEDVLKKEPAGIGAIEGRVRVAG